MIVDQLANVESDFYAGLLRQHGGSFKLADRLMLALRFLQEHDTTALAPGRIDLDGDNVFALVQHYETKPKAQGKWEAHRKYIDVQYLAAGAELMGYANLDHLQAGPYDEDKDFLLAEGSGSFVRMHPGTFVILMPPDAHMPMTAVDDIPAPVKKVVVKVKIAD
jgi:YhcH/YjgK/YiaL family protein